MNDHQLVFVCGLHRSGTSALARILAALPDASGFSHTGVREDEGQFLQQIYPDDNEFGGPGRFGFHPGAHLTECDEELVLRARAGLWDSWAAHWDLDKPVLVEKTPGHLLKIRYLNEVFPGSRFIVLIRHPIAVSLATQKWSRTSVHALVHHWVTCHRTMTEDVAGLHNVAVVHYEDIAADPPRVISQLVDFVGSDCDPATLQSDFEDRNGEYLRRWHEWYLVGDAVNIDGRRFEEPRSPWRRFKRHPKVAAWRNALAESLLRSDRLTISAQCSAHDTVAAFEQPVREWGYSLSERDRPFTNAGRRSSNAPHEERRKSAG